MAELFKNIWDERFFGEFTEALGCIADGFDARLFLSRIRDDEWEHKGFSQRRVHLATVMKDFLPADYKKATGKILELIDCVKAARYREPVKDSAFGLSLEYLFLADFVQMYGSNDYETSVEAIEKITRFTTCEFAVRPFIAKYPDRMMKRMLDWSKNEHWEVRRLASEGCRPRLPWATALPGLKKNPAPIIPILENLKNDPSEIVRKSVANNLNDIAKDNPRTVIDLAKKWRGESKNTYRIVKHGCRTLLKQGNAEALEIFGSSGAENISIRDFRLSTSKVSVGGSLEFGFKLSNGNGEKTRIRLEYGLYYRKANGALSKKVYKTSEREYAGNSITRITGKRSFRAVTTRTFHAGLHRISVIVNGNELEKHDFELSVDKA